MKPGKISYSWVLRFTFIQLTGISTTSVKITYLNGTQKDHVLFCPDFKIGNETLWVKWYFQSEKNLHLLTKWQRESHPRWVIPQKEYKGRLSIPDGKSLEIKNLTLEDSGSYESYIMSVSGKTYMEKFNLTVFDGMIAKINASECLRQKFLLSILFSVLVMLLLGSFDVALAKFKPSLGRVCMPQHREEQPNN